jgi:hypothetical protein
MARPNGRTWRQRSASFRSADRRSGADALIFSCFYKLDGFPRPVTLLNGRTWEKGGFVQHPRAIYDDRGRPMVLINWNTDMGDGWEWSNAEEYPGYLKYTRMSYRMAINEIVYAHALRGRGQGSGSDCRPGFSWPTVAQRANCSAGLQAAEPEIVCRQAEAVANGIWSGGGPRADLAEPDKVSVGRMKPSNRC